MEHNAKTVLTQKMREVEVQPVAWNKADVWLKVEHRISSDSCKRKIHRFYYYAAAAAFLILFSTHTSHEPVTFQANSIVETKVHAEAVSAQPVKENESGIVQKTEIQKARKQKIMSEGQHANKTDNVTVSNEFNKASEPEEIIPMGEPQLVNVAAEEHITPIIGVVIIPEQQQTITKTKRKKLFRKLDSFEQEFDDSFRSIIIARNK